MTTITHAEVRTGFGETRKTRKSAEREAALWNASGSGNRYLVSARTNTTPNIPAHFETIVAEAQPVDGGFACAYITTHEFVAEVSA